MQTLHKHRRVMIQPDWVQFFFSQPIHYNSTRVRTRPLFHVLKHRRVMIQSDWVQGFVFTTDSLSPHIIIVRGADETVVSCTTFSIILLVLRVIY